MLGFLKALIRWSFYLLFFLVPIVFTSNTSELFEFNKMWLTFGLTILIAASWLSVMVIEKRIRIRRTPLDIPILLFLFSQLLATIFSMDPHTSLWGYYSRFNGGLYSLVSYAILYFAFVTLIKRENVMRYIYTGIASAIFVALWGLPSHFGYDPTCLVFRGSLDVSCWTAAFQPKERIFSTLGQPDWMAAYFAYMLPIAFALGLLFWKLKNKIVAYFFLALTILFYADLLFTKSRSGAVGLAIAVGIFAIVYIVRKWRSFSRHALIRSVKHNGFFLTVLFLLALFTFLIGSPFYQLDNFSLAGIQNLIAAQKQVNKALQQKNPTPPQSTNGIPVQEFGGTDSGKIRLFVWEGALQIFIHHPLFGTGVETYGYAYYQYRPAGHNLTSEWDYLYNKAHNEFLNYLATTGIFGFGTYVFMLGVACWIMIKMLRDLSRQEVTEKRHTDALIDDPDNLFYLILALLGAYIGISVTNFFGFSVVIMNIYLFLTPAFALLLYPTGKEKTLVLGSETPMAVPTEMSWVGIGIVWLVAIYFLVVLIRFYQADIAFALGKNLDQANEYQAAYSYLHQAVTTRPSEPTFQDELSVNDAVLSTALFQQKDSTNGAKLRDEAIAVSDAIVSQHPNIVTFWKTRVRVFYTLAQIDPKYMSQALQAIQTASQLAPTDAKVWYNMGLLYDQSGYLDKAIATEEQTIKMKIDYVQAYYALGLFYRQKALGGNATSKVIKDKDAEQKAVETMHFIEKNLDPNNTLKIPETLKSWGEQ